MTMLKSRGNDLPENSVQRRVTDYIGAHLHLPLPVDELARLSGLSRAHFSRVFAAHEGVPPAEFVLNSVSTTQAKLLAMSADLPVKDVSPACAASTTPTTSRKYFAVASG